MARRMRKNQNQNWNPSDVGRSPAEVGARTGQVGMRMPWGVNPAQQIAQSYVKTPMQLAGSALTRRVNRAAPPFADAMSAIGELGSNIGRTGYGMLRDSSRAYFDNADDYGNLKSFGPVLRAAQRAYAQNVPNVKQSASRASTAIGDAYEPVRDFMGGLYDYGTSAGYAMGRGGRSVGGAMYRGLRDTVRPFLGEAEPGDVVAPSMVKRGKSSKKTKISNTKKSMMKRQAGPKPNKYFS